MLVGQLKDIENETNECQELIEQLREGEDISQIVKSRDGHDFEKRSIDFTKWVSWLIGLSKISFGTLRS